jgi:hypothetical protein
MLNIDGSSKTSSVWVPPRESAGDFIRKPHEREEHRPMGVTVRQQGRRSKS